MYKRSLYQKLYNRLAEPTGCIQVLTGPRQVGKTTLALQVLKHLKIPHHYASADEPSLKDPSWIAENWELARMRANTNPQGAVLVLDEVQKIPQWSERVKYLWDHDKMTGVQLRVLLLGSAPLLLQQGLTESLAGRFENIPITHWTYSECEAAFKWSLDQYIYFGGYPGAAPFVEDEQRWSDYIRDSLIETTISRDIMLLTRINKPALLRQLFYLGCQYSGQILSYQKMLGQLQDAGNTTTLAHYLNLLDQAGMLTGLQKYSTNHIQHRSSSPKLQVFNTGLITAQHSNSFMQAQSDRSFWGRLVESAVGAHLINLSRNSDLQVFYWRERNKEVDFVLTHGKDVLAIEVKSGHKRESLSGMAEFSRAFTKSRQLVVGKHGLPIEEFLRLTTEQIFSNF